jgi:hypothetical protein
MFQGQGSYSVEWGTRVIVISDKIMILKEVVGCRFDFRLVRRLS